MKLIACVSLFLLSSVAQASLQRRSQTNAVATTPIMETLLSYDNTTVEAIKAFKGIIFGDFTAEQGTQRFNRSLAVKDNFNSNGFAVNTNTTTITCSSNTTSLSDVGLVVGGALSAINTTVNGAVSYASGSEITNACLTNITVDFDNLQREALNISQYFAQQKPNMVIRDGGFLSDGQFLGSSNQDYYIYTFNLCQEKTNCVMPEYLYSSPEQIFHGGNWTGPYNIDYPKDRPIIFNVPILTDSVFNLSTANPAAGLEGADILYNVYPVKNTGAYDEAGHVVWLRNSTMPINGFVLAPSAYIIENNKGGFSDNLIASRYLSVFDLDTMFGNDTTSITYPNLINSTTTTTTSNTTTASS